MPPRFILFDWDEEMKRILHVIKSLLKKLNNASLIHMSKLQSQTFLLAIIFMDKPMVDDIFSSSLTKLTTALRVLSPQGL